MRIDHPTITIVIEGEEERDLLHVIAAVACSLGEQAIRENRVCDRLITAGIEPLQPRHAARMRDFAEKLLDA